MTSPRTRGTAPPTTCEGSRTAPPGTEAPFLTVDEAAALLRINRKTLYEAVSAGSVPGVIRFGRVIRINRAALLASGWGNGGSALGEKS
jgi:excisionase family DNA binding protein